MRCALLVAGVLVARVAAAEKPPWENVPEDQQRQANAVFAAGNELFSQRSYGAALKKYREAVAMWDHPMVRFNMAVTLIRLDRILEAAVELDHALRYGATPFTPELYQQAFDYQALVRGRVGDAEVTCDQAGTRVLLDGKPWFECPGTQKIRLMAGEHVVVGQRGDYVTSSKRLVVVGGATTTESLELVPLDQAVQLTYPLPRWLTWTIAGAGTAVALGGAGVWFAGRRQQDRYEVAFSEQCPGGCDVTLYPELVEERDAARFKGKLGVGMIVGGSTVALAGIVMTILNRPKRQLPRVEITPGQTGVAATLSWQY